jgi:hypothetical protein
MNSELPKSIRSALAAEETVPTHPSADLLTAFAEHTLSMGENDRIADHLARCPQCRQVIFLASNADEQAKEEPARAAIQATLRPRSRWTGRLVWVVSGAVGIAIVGGILVRQHLDHDGSTQKLAQVADVTTQQPPAASTPEASNAVVITPEAQKPLHEQKARSMATGNVPRRPHSDVLATRSAPQSKPESASVASVPPASAVNPSPEIAVGGTAGSFNVAAPKQNAFAEHQDGSQAQGLTPPLPIAPQVLMRQRSTTQTWRVTPDGHLEHFSQTGWTGVLSDKPVKFQVVSETRNGVWAGGSRGELFRSADGGEHWSEITLPAPPDNKGDSIVAIHFIDLQHGMIVTESGLHYNTSDGGQSWSRE